MQKIEFTIEKELQHQGICDASGAIALGENHFIVANDESNLLRIYAADQSGSAIATVDIHSYFDNNPNAKEVDLEAAAQIDDVIYWISSHGRNKKGKFRPERHQLFAHKRQPSGWEFEQIGRSYTQLVLGDMLNDSRLDRYRLKDAEQLPPKAVGGLNIEGLSVTPSGELLIGFRSPVVNGKALLVPLNNPRELVEGAAAVLGDPIELDLGGLGIRSVEYWEAQNQYIIVAGASDAGDRFALYQWSGLDEPPQRIEGTGFPSDFRPEAVLFYPHRPNDFQLLSDDGSLVRVNDLPCKEIEDEHHPQKFFRSLWVRGHKVVQE
jgi:Protein of unknown function (DUF3616)